MNGVRELMFSYNMKNRIRTSSDRIRRSDGSLKTSSYTKVYNKKQNVDMNSNEDTYFIENLPEEPNTSTNFPERLEFLLIDGDCPENSLLEAPPGQMYDASGSSNLIICKYKYKYLDVSTVAHSLEKHKSVRTNLIEVNTLVSIESATGDDNRTEIADEDHRPDPCHRGFLDPYYTPQSKAAGKVRIFCAGVCVRIMTTRTIEIAQDIMSSCSGLL
ncbi:hypothetical protein QIS74_11676 [Colletotrichum tabaci]|uniref:Uncharacterized protein n=1 Tax=Colletotrichum tabaci TaxID=1209068 RepID=A0AAV9SZG9_9PEZI